MCLANREAELHPTAFRMMDMMDFAAARVNMVDSQIRPNGITDRRIIDAMLQVPREEFVPVERRPTAYMDEDVLLTAGPPSRSLIEAMAFAKLVQLAMVRPTDKVLHIGAATGYGTAVLSRLAEKIVAVESDAQLLAILHQRLAGLANVSVLQGAMQDGASQHKPFDVILIEGKVGEVPPHLFQQLAPEGCLVAVHDEGDVGVARLWTIAGSTPTSRYAFNASVAPLPGFARKRPAFVF